MTSDVIWTPQKDLLFRIKKYRDKIAEGIANSRVLFAGEFQIFARNEAGYVIPKTEPFHNHITNAGLDMCGNETYASGLTAYGSNGGYVLRSVQVGTGSSPPADTDTVLGSYLAGANANNSPPVYTAQQTTLPWYAEQTITYTFATGAVSGNISEIGVGPNSGSGTTLFARELIRDGSGTPTTITILSTEALIVTYKLRMYYWNGIDVVSSISAIDHGTPTSITLTRRPNNTSEYWAAAGAWRLPLASSGTLIWTSSTSLPAAGTAITSPQLNGAAVFNSYSTGSYQRTCSTTFPSGTAATIRTIVLTKASYSSSSYGAFMTGLSTALSKTTNDSLTVGGVYSWGRYP